MGTVTELRRGAGKPEVVAERAQLAQRLGAILRRSTEINTCPDEHAVVEILFRTSSESRECKRLLGLIQEKSRRRP